MNNLNTLDRARSIQEVKRLISRGYKLCYSTQFGIFPYGSETLEKTLVKDPHEVEVTEKLLELLMSNDTVCLGVFNWK
mgnify:FL=1